MKKSVDLSTAPKLFIFEVYLRWAVRTTSNFLCVFVFFTLPNNPFACLGMLHNNTLGIDVTLLPGNVGPTIMNNFDGIPSDYYSTGCSHGFSAPFCPCYGIRVCAIPWFLSVCQR